MFENETKIDLETNMRVSRNVSHKMRITSCILNVCLIILGIVLLLLELYVFKEGDYFLSIFLIAMGAVLLLFMLLLYPFVQKITGRALQGKESIMHYVFNEDGYEVVTNMNDGTSSTTSGNYSAFTKCNEYVDMWMMYLNQATVFIVRKDGMKSRTAEELSQFLLSKFGAKYKVCYKKR